MMPYKTHDMIKHLLCRLLFVCPGGYNTRRRRDNAPSITRQEWRSLLLSCFQHDSLGAPVCGVCAFPATVRDRQSIKNPVGRVQGRFPRHSTGGGGGWSSRCREMGELPPGAVNQKPINSDRISLADP
jgi:hypothetical protein